MPPFHATPLTVPPEFERHAIAALHALDLARFAPEQDLLAAFAPEGLAQPIVETWAATGIVHRGGVVTDAVKATETTYLALTTSGARSLSLVSGKPASGIRPASLRRSPPTRAHEVAKGAVVLAFLALEREGRISLAGIQADDKKLATSVVVRGPKGAERIGLQPDLLVVVRRERGNVAVLVEVDRGSVAVRRMTAKYAAYGAWKASGGPERDLGLRAVRIVTVVPTERRLARLHDAALGAMHGRRSGLFLFALQDRFRAASPSTLLEPIARVTAPGEPVHVPLVEAA